jgi:hypothetical protein
MVARYGWTILALGAVLGGFAGWLIDPLLDPHGYLLVFFLVPVAAWIGLLVGYLVARRLAEGSGKAHDGVSDRVPDL